MVRRVHKSQQDVLKLRGEILLRFFNRRRGFILRCLLCWVVGCLALSSDELPTYDQRFQLRGDQKVSKEIVLITIRQSDFAMAYDKRTNYIGDIDQIADITDSFFWNRRLWTQLLEKILVQNPRSVGVTLYFGDNLGSVKLNRYEESLFRDQRIVWSSTMSSLERVLNPVFSNYTHTNIGTNELRRDEDGVVRRVFPQRNEVPHLIEKITGTRFPKAHSVSINYRGSSKVFKQYTLSEILFDDIPKNTFTNKVILIGAETSTGPQYITPVGSLSRTEILAHMTDNLLEGRWIQRLNFWLYTLVFIPLLLLAVFIITRYPQSVALFFIAWLGTLIAALSAWIFDSFYFWIPAASPFVLLTASWIIFIGYQATRIERKNFTLQQEQKSLHELEQLKNNFVSLISHDLKTPIAKIQAIVDRLLTQYTEDELHQDLRSLRTSSDELNRYIQSILKVLRVESKDFKVNKEAADINETIEEAVLQLKLLAQEKSICIRTTLEPMFSVEYDVVLMKEVLINIIENAIKYTSAGGEIHITSKETKDDVYVEVKDTGEGIQSTDLEKVWGKFTRGSDQELKSKGSGLGLYLVKYFIELHGGKVTMQSQFGIGTTVSFKLPLQWDETEEATTEEMV